MPTLLLSIPSLDKLREVSNFEEADLDAALPLYCLCWTAVQVLLCYVCTMLSVHKNLNENAALMLAKNENFEDFFTWKMDLVESGVTQFGRINKSNPIHTIHS